MDMAAVSQVFTAQDMLNDLTIDPYQFLIPA